MKNNNLSQKANNAIVQIQANNIYYGMTEEQFRIEMNKEREFIIERINISSDLANKRFDNFIKILFPKLVKNEMYSAFSDPNFILIMRESMKEAICTDNKEDYEILSELLMNQDNLGKDYLKKTAIKKAIPEINNISKESLKMLTIFFAIESFVPELSNLTWGISRINDFYKKALENFELPKDKLWIENLELVGAIRVNRYIQSKKLEDFLCKQYDGYSSLGILKSGEKYKKCVTILNDAGLNEESLVENELDSDYVRIPVCNKNMIKNLKISSTYNGELLNLNQKQINALEMIYDMYDEKNQEVNNRFKEILFGASSIKQIIEWWNNNMLDISIEITQIGKVIACVYCRIIDSLLPNFWDNNKTDEN